MLSVIYAECYYAERLHAECRYAECSYAECRGAHFSAYSVGRLLGLYS
jgi:hypothetical protein